MRGKEGGGGEREGGGIFERMLNLPPVVIRRLHAPSSKMQTRALGFP
jgi:hypothetical protein